MSSKNIIITIEELDLIDLPSADQELVGHAKAAAADAYAPYSHFRVGAALRLNSGRIVTGSNQENAAYPSGLCAERTALFYAGAKYPEDPVAKLAVVAMREDGKMANLAAPCGGCRQVMLEVADRFKQPFSVILAGEKSAKIISDCRDLLPINFDASSL